MTGQWEDKKSMFYPIHQENKVFEMKEINMAGLVQYTFSLANIGSSDGWVCYDSDRL